MNALNTTPSSSLPVVALTLGDPAGIGAELITRLLAKPEATALANVVLIGDAWLWEEGQRIAGYLLTPLLVFLATGWDLSQQRSHSLSDARRFVPEPRFTRWLYWLSGAALVLGAWHVLNISVPVSEWLAR